MKRLHKLNLILIFSCPVALTIFMSSSIAESNVEVNGQETLQFVQMIFRHGDKNPEMTYPNDPYNESFWPGGYNYITEKGKRRMYDLGIYFRERYPGLLSKEYVEDEIYVASSDRDRTIISASAFLTGLYRENNLESQWNPDMHWDPIPVRTIEKKYDRYVEVTESCPKMAEILKDLIFKSEFTHKLLEDNKEMLDYIVSHSGFTAKNLVTVAYVVQALQIEEENGLELPAWTKRVLQYKPFTGLLMAIHREMHTNKLWTFLRSGPLAQKLISNVEEVIRLKEENNSARRKMVVFSGHDRTVVDIMMALNIYHPDIEQPPYYGATLIFELHRDDENQYFVNVLYKNDSSVAPHKMQLPNCESPCYVNNFKTVVNNFSLGDWEQECQVERDNGFDRNSLKNYLVTDAGSEKDTGGDHAVLPLFLFCAVLILGAMIFLNS